MSRPTNPAPLSERQVAEIEAREAETPYALGQPLVPLTPEERDALCATARALRALLRHADQTIGDAVDANTALREQLAQVQREYAALQQINDAAECERQNAESRLAQVERERNELRARLT